MKMQRSYRLAQEVLDPWLKRCDGMDPNIIKEDLLTGLLILTEYLPDKFLYVLANAGANPPGRAMATPMLERLSEAMRVVFDEVLPERPAPPAPAAPKKRGHPAKD